MHDISVKFAEMFIISEVAHSVGNSIESLGRALPQLRAVLVKSRALARLAHQLALPAAFAAEAAGNPRLAPVPAAWLPRIVPTQGVQEYRATALTWLRRHPGAAMAQRFPMSITVSCGRAMN